MSRKFLLVRWFCLGRSDFDSLSSLGFRYSSFMSQRLHRIDFGGLPSREIACNYGCAYQER